MDSASQLLWVKNLAQSLVFHVRYTTWVEDLVPLDLALYNLVPLGLALWKMHDVAQMLDRILSTSE